MVERSADFIDPLRLGYTRTIPKEQPTTITSPKGTPAALQAARDRCKARGSGWVWDEATRTCTRVSNKPVGAGGSIDTEEKRQATRQVGDTERQKLMVQAGVETSAAKALEAKNREYAEATEILGSFEKGPTFEERMSETELSDIFNKQTVLAGAKGSLDTAISRAGQFAAIGAGIGAVGGGVAAAIPTAGAAAVPGAAAGGFAGGKAGAGIGFIFGLAEGFWKGASSNAASQASGHTGARAKTIRAVKTDMTRDVSTMWSGRGNKADLAADFMKRKNDAWDAYAQLTVDVRREVNLAMGEDGTVILQQYKEFFAPGGQAEILEEEMKTALFSAPNIERADQLFAEANNEAILAALELAAK